MRHGPRVSVFGNKPTESIIDSDVDHDGYLDAVLSDEAIWDENTRVLVGPAE